MISSSDSPMAELITKQTVVSVMRGKYWVLQKCGVAASHIAYWTEGSLSTRAEVAAEL